MPPDASKRSATARAGARGLHDSFYAATDPDLPDEERQRQAEQARSTFYRGRARMGAHARNARATSRAAITQGARDALFRKYYDATDPDLPEEERQRQAKSKESEFMQGIALRRETARKRAAIAMNNLTEAEAQAAAFDADAV